MKSLILPALLLGLLPALSFAGDRGHGGDRGGGGSGWNVSVGVGATFGDGYRGYDRGYGRVEYRERSYCPPRYEVRSRTYGPGVIYDRSPRYCPPTVVYAPPVAYCPPPVVYAPPVVYSPPVTYCPPPVVYAPPVTYCPPPVVYYGSPRATYYNSYNSGASVTFRYNSR